MDKAEILRQTTNGLDIYQHVLNRMGSRYTLKEGKNPGLKNPFYEDTRGSLSISFSESSGEYLFKDFGNDDYQGDALAFFGHYSSLNPSSQFPELIERLRDELQLVDHGLDIHSPKLASEPTPDVPPKDENSKPQYRQIEDYSYWQSLFPNIQDLPGKAKKFGLFSVSQIECGRFKLKGSKEAPIFAFQLGDNCFKIYRPTFSELKTQSKHAWVNKQDLEKEYLLRNVKPGEPCLLTEGYKDAFSGNLHGLNTAPIDNAGSGDKYNLIDELKRLNCVPIICFDNDDAGKRGAEKLQKSSKAVSVINLPNQLDGKPIKDLTDLLTCKGGQDWINREVRRVGQFKDQYTPIMRDLLDTQDIIFQNARKEITWSKALLNSNDKGLIYPNTTNTVQGLSGTHKSRVCEILAATALSKDRNANHGFVRSEEVENINVLYVDTERNLFDQLPYAVQQISRLATGNSFNKPANFDCLSLVGIPRNDRFSSLTEYISNFINTNTGHTLVILDVITDCLDDFNNVQSSLPLTDLMNRLCNQYDVTFVVVIHANPNSEKARGHLGTELINKSSCCLSLSLNQEVIELKCTKIRVGKKPDPLYYAYCDEEKHLVLTSQPDEAKKTGRGSAKAPLAGVAAFLEQLDPKKDYDKKEVTEDLMRVFGCGERTIDERLKSLRDTDQYLMHNSRPHTLVMEKRGKISFKPVHDDSQSQLPI